MAEQQKQLQDLSDEFTTLQTGKSWRNLQIRL